MAKKKTNPQSKNNKSPETQLAIPRQTIDEGSSEKLYYLKTLNAMLLEETVERRQQVHTLTRVNRSLGSELNRCESQLNELIERVVMLEFENKLVSGFFALLGKEMLEICGKERVAMEEEIRELERDASRVLDETNAIEKAKNKKVVDFEEKCIMSFKKVEDMRTEIDVLVKEKQEMEGDLRRLTEEKNLVSKDLQEALKKTEHQKLIIDEIVVEKTRINYAKNQGEGYIVQLNGEIDDLKNTIRTQRESEGCRRKIVFPSFINGRKVRGGEGFWSHIFLPNWADLRRK
ncbi:uncharacterized protein LOC111916132 [Lactuca sativa]|uniref:Uncharacterized protein n=1 Tax=Lactuca sativa TaxID=4236 RepID=A0A9R1XAV6_LACSA|nr:uncharacterized protein LOC111916132 [Lactuca sativa]KAJ0205509.1 hypothetical protein LSAT_V11C500243310 [Lactuca sativa]